MTGHSSIRARHAQNNIEATEILGPEATARLRAAVAPETWRRIEEASRLEWLPVELDIEAFEAGGRVFGVENNHARVRAGLKRTIEGPLLKALLEGAANLFGIRPSSLFRFSSLAWPAVFRDCGRFGVDQSEPGRMELRCREAPEVFFAHPSYLEGTAAALGAVMEICRVEGKVELAAVDRAAGTFGFVATWVEIA